MTILITGGGSGLGKSITIALAGDKNNIVYFTYNNSFLNAKEIEKKYKNAISIKCDFKNINELNELKEKIIDLNLDLLVNNAYSGEAIKTYFHKIPFTEFQTDFTNNILPTVIITQSVISSFRKNKKTGKIITILSSFLMNTPPIGASIYVANKAYLKSLVNSWATENSKFNISSNSVSPSFMQTNFTKDVDERIIEQMKNSHPLKRLLTLEEVAESIVFLKNSSLQINGIDIPLNAGLNIK